METAILISKILGIIYFAFGIGMLVNPSFYRREIPKLHENSAYLILGGFLAIVFGFLILEGQNTWPSDWTVVITILGWIAILKGAILLAFPNSMNLFKPLFESKLFMNILTPSVIIMGAIFIYLGFFTN